MSAWNRLIAKIQKQQRRGESAQSVAPGVTRGPHQLPAGVQDYAYSPLQGPQSIRLLQVLSVEDDKILECRIFDADLDGPCPSYIALSYTWDEPGLPEEKKPILVNGRVLRISQNLFNFFQNYRCSTGERIIWVDQICINQADVDERAAQVTLMNKIYKQAPMDLCWIGEPDQHSYSAMNLLEKLASLYRRLEESSTAFPSMSGIDDPFFMSSCGLPPFPSEEWHSLMHFISRRVFSRIWIVQEISIPQRVTVACGLNLMGFDQVALAAKFLQITSWVKRLHSAYTVPGKVGSLTSILNCRLRHHWDTKQDLNLLLASTRRFAATNPVDKIYALLSLCDDCKDGRIPPALLPNYHSSVVDVYCNFTIYLISQGSLEVLSGIEDERYRAIQELPSWVPDFSVHQEASILGMPTTGGEKSYYAAATKLPVIFREESPNVLGLSAHVVDSISTVSPADTADSAVDYRLERWARLIDFGSQYPMPHISPIEGFWRTVVGNSCVGSSFYHGQAEVPPSSWGQGFCALLLRSKRDLSDFTTQMSSLNDLSEANAAFVQHIQDTPGIDSALDALRVGAAALDEPDNDLRSPFEAAMHHASFVRLFCLSTLGYMGLCPRSTRPGDLIVLFAGGRVPFIIRKAKDSDHYRIVGECYVHGIMDGELLEGNSELEWVELKFR